MKLSKNKNKKAEGQEGIKKEERERETDRTVLACISNYQSQSNCYC